MEAKAGVNIGFPIRAGNAAAKEWFENCELYMNAVAEGLPDAARFKRPCVSKLMLIPGVNRLVKLRFERVQATDGTWGWRVRAKDFAALKKEVFK